MVCEIDAFPTPAITWSKERRSVMTANHIFRFEMKSNHFNVVSAKKTIKSLKHKTTVAHPGTLKYILRVKS